MKKILYSALALPLLFACSSEDFDNQAINNDPFAGIEKVDATFTMDESTTRFDGNGEGVEPAWKAQEGDLWGFAWLGDGTIIKPDDVTNGGKAFQNHNLIQTNGIFTPQTSIYVGSYYLYRPYDGTTVSPQAINFKSLEEQPFVEGYASTTQAWKNLAKTAINIADCWTNVTADGHVVEGKTWDKAGREQSYKLYPAMFSNQTLLDLTYVNNNPKFAAAKEITGATDITFTCAKGEAVGAAVIYDATVQLAGAAKSFTYAPKESPNDAAHHNGEYWADKDGAVDGGVTGDDGFTFTPGAITLTPANAEEGLSTGTEGNEAKFWFNSLPVSTGDGELTTDVVTTFTTSYGNVTVNSTVGECAYEFAKYDNDATGKEWIKLAGADSKTVTPKTWNLAGDHNTFVNQYGNHKGKFKFDVDFATGNLATLHIKSDDHLQTVLKYYIASGKTAPVELSLDKNSSNTFALSKISIALLQTINKTSTKVTIKPCTTEGHTPTGIIITQAGQKGTALEDATDVPSLEKVFAAATSVQLSGGYNWTWKSDEVIKMGNVNSITLLPGDASGKGGKLNVTSTNVAMSGDAAVTLTISRGAEMNITKVTTVKNALTNKGTINVNVGAELRAYGVAITNEASALGVSGTINNSGVVGVSAGVAGGSFNNYGVIDMKSEDAITLLTTNATSANAFGAEWSATNKMGTVILPNGNPTALVSVSNATSEGFIKYNWTGATYATPAGNVKYNTIVVSGDITFTAEEEEIKYIEFDGTRTQVVNPEGANKLPQLKGVIVNAGKSIIIEMTNILNPTLGAYLGSGATVYKGGIFQKNGADYAPGAVTNYLGEWNTNQIVEY